MDDTTPILHFFNFVAEIATAIGVGIAAWQLWIGRKQAVTAFEDTLAREYRELAKELPTKVFLDDGVLSDEEYRKAFDTFYRYFDFSNEQVFLRKKNRVSKATWIYWCDGIQSNMKRKGFSKAWTDISQRVGGDFRELRRLIASAFNEDPHDWKGKTDPLACVLLVGLIGMASFQSNAQTNAIQSLGQQSGTNGVGKAGTFSLPPGDKVIGPATPQTLAEFKALEEIKTKAENGDANSQCALGEIYEGGTVWVMRDIVEAVKWYRKAAEQGNTEAEFNLGDCYATGHGVSRDDREAVKWFQKAADQGYAEAQANLGVMYRYGRGVAQDYVEAVKLYRKAAAQGLPAAQVKLGLQLEHGVGVPQDYVEAYKWYNLAAVTGETNAVLFRSALAAQMTPSQIAEAQELSREFKPRKAGSDNSIPSDQPVATGTGFFITADGYLISNYHVVKDAAKVRLLTGAGMVDAKVVQSDAANDLALLKAEGHFACLPVTASRGVQLGNTVGTVGFPDPGLQGFSPKLAKGEIAALAGAADDARYFQVSLPVQPGNSGGALVDERGNVVGIVSAKLDAATALASSGALPENVNYAVKSSFLLSFLESVPDVSAKLKAANTKDEKFEDVVKDAQAATVLVLVY